MISFNPESTVIRETSHGEDSEKENLLSEKEDSEKEKLQIVCAIFEVRQSSVCSRNRRAHMPGL